MEISPLRSISPIDGRYWEKTKELAEFFSEHALIKYRVQVEVEYFIALCELPLPQLKEVDPSIFEKLRKVYKDFSTEDAERIKAIEQETAHDVKAVEYFLKERFSELGLEKSKEFIHFGLTSQDINNTAIPMALRDSMNEVYRPLLNELLSQLSNLTGQWQDISLLARTHGQPASPTKLGKEVFVFIERMEKQMELIDQVPVSAKFGGATGNFNAHHVAYPQIDWIAFADEFVGQKLELSRSRTTTQIEHYDNMGALFDGMKRVNTILIDMARDFWTYISMDYFRQKTNKQEVGSSAMPHKVNPIDLENAEGNFGIANALFSHLSEKLPISRLQRDLTDSTVIRNIGVPLAHTVLALKSLIKGMGKLEVNQKALNKDLEANWATVAEAIQTILRREGYPAPYEALKELTRGRDHIDKQAISAFIDQLDVPETIKKELKAISPASYTGIRPLHL